jgi:hypothetical protein
MAHHRDRAKARRPLSFWVFVHVMVRLGHSEDHRRRVLPSCPYLEANAARGDPIAVAFINVYKPEENGNR